MLDAIEKGQIQFTDLQLDQRQAILNHPDRAIARRGSELMKAQGAMVVSNRQALVDEWTPVTEMKGTIENGVAMYKKHCAQCHKHGELGVAIGPNLTGMAVHPKHEILMNVLDPSRSVESNFRTYQVLTADGKVINGMLAGESANSIRIVNTQGKEEQVLRADIEEMNASPKSLMPEGFEASISKQEMADLLTFLNNRGRYTPLTLATAATISGAKGLPGFRGGAGDKFEFKTTVLSKSKASRLKFKIPKKAALRTSLHCKVPEVVAQRRCPLQRILLVRATCLQFTFSVQFAAFGPPNTNPSASLIVRCHYEDGSHEEHELVNGKHLATYREKVDVPESKFALDANGKQIRYLKIAVTKTTPMKSIEFVKGPDFSFPLIFAVTVESADKGDH